MAQERILSCDLTVSYHLIKILHQLFFFASITVNNVVYFNTQEISFENQGAVGDVVIIIEVAIEK